jgi:hypothetical protein
MASKNLASLSDDELVWRFRKMAVETGEAVVNWLPAAKKTRQLFAIKNILRARGQESRLKLATLLRNEDRFVKYYAAEELLYLLPQECGPIIMANTQEYDAIASDARFSWHLFEKRQNYGLDPVTADRKFRLEGPPADLRQLIASE